MASYWGPVKEITAAFAPRSYVCKKAKFPLTVLDGRLDKLFWEDAPFSELFEDIEDTSVLIEGGSPSPRPRPRKQTRMKMKWDENYLYIGAKLYEDEIWAYQTERDSVIFYDNDFEVFIDPDGDTHLYYEFEMNARNTVWDLLLPKPYRDGAPPINAFDYQGLKTAVYIDGKLNDPTARSHFWSVEIAFPMEVLIQCCENNLPKEGNYWRINFSRVEWLAEVKDGGYQRKLDPETGKPYPEDNWIWSPTGIVDMHCPERWGFLLFAGESGAADFVIPRDEYIKWELRKLYYRQRNLFAQTGSFTTDFSALKQEDCWTIDPQIAITPTEFDIWARTADAAQNWHIRTDGLIYRY